MRRQARAQQELLVEHLVPEVVDLLGLGEEAVAAEVEAVAVADLGLGDAADLVLGLEDDHGVAALGEQVAGGEPGGAAAEHGDGQLATAVAGRPGRGRTLTCRTGTWSWKGSRRGLAPAGEKGASLTLPHEHRGADLVGTAHRIRRFHGHYPEPRVVAHARPPRRGSGRARAPTRAPSSGRGSPKSGVDERDALTRAATASSSGLQVALRRWSASRRSVPSRQSVTPRSATGPDSVAQRRSSTPWR